MQRVDCRQIAIFIVKIILLNVWLLSDRTQTRTILPEHAAQCLLAELLRLARLDVTHSRWPCLGYPAPISKPHCLLIVTKLSSRKLVQTTDSGVAFG